MTEPVLSETVKGMMEDFIRKWVIDQDYHCETWGDVRKQSRAALLPILTVAQEEAKAECNREWVKKHGKELNISHT
jgi:hypothetical protein